ncbi:MAG: glycosyltransferase family 2 protein [Bacteroidota bacterium]|nr:glycosyltransferase family 2 protein [Bacteroidota bacterium]
MIKLSIIIVNYKTREYLRELLNSIKEHLSAETKYEVFVVDNASNDGSVEMLNKGSLDVTLIESKENLGFSKANNLAIAQSRGEIILLLNPDTMLLPDHKFDEILKRFENDVRIGIIGGRVYDRNLIQVSSYGRDPTPFTLVFHFSFLGKVLARLIPPLRKYRFANYYKKAFQIEKEVEIINGCCFFIRRKTIDDIGMLDERFFIFLEEGDICVRARSSGWKVIYTPLKTVIHFGQESTKQNRIQMSEQFLKSLKIFYEKHYPFDMKKLEWILRMGIIKPRIKKGIKR